MKVYEAGDILPNGALVIEHKARLGGKGEVDYIGVVLAARKDSIEPYVTWTTCEEVPTRNGLQYADSNFYCINGHYFSSITDAAADYKERLEREGLTNPVA